MKKKLLILLAALAMLVCIFAISVSAKTVTTVDGKEVTVTTYDDAPTKTNITVSTYDVVVFDDGFVCPSGYIFKDGATNYGDGDGDARIQHLLDFSYINEKTGKTYTYVNIAEFDFPEGVTHITKRAFQKVTTIKKVTIPSSVKTMSVAIFQGATGLEECVLEHGENDGLVKFPGYTFYGCTNLKAFSMPDCVTEIHDVGTFSECTNLTAVHLSKNLVTWNSGGGGSRTATFDDCCAMYFVNEAFTPDNVPSKPEVYYFPANLEFITNNSVCRECKNLNDVLVFGTKITEMPNQYFFQNGPANKIVFLGDMTTVTTKYWGKTTDVYFANPNDKSLDDVTFSGGKNAVFCNAEDNTNHLYLVEANTLPTCTEAGVKGFACFCGKPSDTAEEIPALGHEENELISKYFASINGTLDYYSDMITEHSCTRCDEIIKGTKNGTALFGKKGYSFSESDASTFSYTIYVNADAIKAYNAELLYGIVVSANANGAPITLTDGAISHDNKTIAIELQDTETAYSIITAKLTGVGEDTELHLSAYCVDNGTVSYLGHNTVDKIAETISHEALLEKYPSGKEE